MENKKDSTNYLHNVLLIGNPNVGKSLTFNKLTGLSATVSNYPGTTVDIDTGNFKIYGETIEITDPPGMYDLNTITEEERIAKLLLFSGDYDLVVHVIDAKNIDKSIDLTLQLIDAGTDVILVLNMIDELDRMGAKVDKEGLSAKLGIPVVLTSAANDIGLDELKNTILNYDDIKKNIDSNSKAKIVIHYGNDLESSINKVESKLEHRYDEMTNRAVAILLLEGDKDIRNTVKKHEKNYADVFSLVDSIEKEYDDPIKYLTKLQLSKYALYFKDEFTTINKVKPQTNDDFKEKLSRLMIHPVYGLIILALVLYFGLYLFVGVLGAGYLVDFFEDVIFGEWINPFLTQIVLAVIPWKPIQDLFIGSYGIVTFGLSYGIGIIFPIVSLFFIVFSILEDSGYLPRLALLTDNAFKKIGLSGRSIIPMVLAVGCGSMATMTTRTLETNRERIIATILMALTIPCSAQLGVIMSLLSSHPITLWIWLGIIIFNFIVVGLIAKRFVPGSQASFFMELPPLRVPKPKHILKKTWTRVVMYIKELLPIFILISVLIWGLDLVGIFQLIIKLFNPIIQAIGLPTSTTQSFILGFFRRDFGAAGILKIRDTLTGVQLLVASVTLTLFVPCIAQFIVMIKERGVKMAVGIAILSIVLAFTAGFLLNLVLTTFGVVF
ncbi:ferrous iron transport protein B [Methanobrevibacter boviskoreani]|uniref:ferrous iron transport protein B n=1 Tax=Methanobrevibacter boviskoreani TaxID=1348249 RepID=UPI0023F2A449|nr:ferrous iron transport protein B [Methanobrevibacter boviskoreani]MDD6257049.1 ferrous iron transport protein B [Methanobrevibacter boviskoreani]